MLKTNLYNLSGSEPSTVAHTVIGKYFPCKIDLHIKGLHEDVRDRNVTRYLQSAVDNYRIIT
jgi:hypothetical protein